jgi:GAF domain-containing protein
MTALPALSQLIRQLVRSDDGAALLDRLHEHLLDAADGVASLVVHRDPITARLRASSGCRVDHLPLSPWAPSPAEQAAVERASSLGRVVPLDVTAGSPAGELLGTPAAVVVPLVGPDGSRGVVFVGLAAAAAAGPPEEERVLAVADAFVLALDRARLRRASNLRREVDGVVNTFRADAGSRSDLNRALGGVCRTCSRLFVAQRAAAWLHDRRARELVLAATSEGGHGRQSARVAVVDSLSRAAAALRHGPPELGSDAGPTDAPPYLLVPLRGQRRALGVLEFEGVHIEPGDEAQVIEAATALGQELAAAIETVLLFEQAVRAERELGAVFEIADDPMIVCDAELRVVRGTPAFAARAGVPLADLAGRELRDLLGDALERQIHEAAAGEAPDRRAFRAPAMIAGEAVTIEASPIDSDDGTSGLVLVVRDRE